MLRRIFTLLFVSCLAAPAVLAQPLDPVFLETYGKYRLNKFLEGENLTYTGSPYLDTAFVAGEILMRNGSVFNAIPLRYNIYNDVIEFRKDGIAIELGRDFGYKSFNMDGRKFLLAMYSYGSYEAPGHLEILCEGNYTLLKRYRIDFQQTAPAGAYKESEPASFISLKPDYFVKVLDNNAINFNNEKGLMNVCMCNKDELKAFIKANRINFKKEESLIRLFEFLNNK